MGLVRNKRLFTLPLELRTVVATMLEYSFVIGTQGCGDYVSHFTTTPVELEKFHLRAPP